MDMRSYVSILLSLSLATAGLDPDRTTPPERMPRAEAANATAGLTLPPDFTVPGDQGFVEVQADSPGEVRFAVLGSQPVRYKLLPKSVIVATPASGGSVVIVAVAVVNGTLSEFARTVVTITPAGPSPGPAPPAPPAPEAVKGKLYVTIVTDSATQTPAQAAVVNSAALRQLVQQRGALRVVERSDPWLANRKLDAFVPDELPGLIVQSEDGAVRLSRSLPKTEKETLALIRQLQGVQP